MLVPYRQQLAALLDGKVGTTAGIFVRGGNIERRQESPLGDLIADGMRWRYGTQLGLMNSGGIRIADAVMQLLAGEHERSSAVLGLRGRRRRTTSCSATSSPCCRSGTS